LIWGDEKDVTLANYIDSILALGIKILAILAIGLPKSSSFSSP